MLNLMKQKKKDMNKDSPQRSSFNSSSRSSSDRSTSVDLLLKTQSDDSSIYSSYTNNSTISYKTKYEPQKSIHKDISEVFARPIRSSYSRGHEIPEPRSPHQSTGFSSPFRPHTSGTKLPPCYSPIRPLETSRGLFSRATSPVMLRHGRDIPVDMISIKYRYPLNSISYEKPSILASNIHNASLPSGAESILEDTRFQSIAPFSKREFYQSMSVEQQHELAKRRRHKRLVTTSYPTNTPPLLLDYERRGTKNAAKRYVHKILI